MSPYRRPPTEQTEPVQIDRVDDDRILGLLLLLVGGVRVVPALLRVREESFGPEPTIAAVMVVLALAMLLRRR